MSSAAGQSPEFRDSSTGSEKDPSSKLKSPPSRPALVSPPKRPTPPKSPDKSTLAAAKVNREPAETAKSQVPLAAVPVPEPPSYPQPIAPPSEPMQYRAIGLVKGVYTPDEEQFNHGNMTTEDGAVIDAVLLGRVTSLVKKHIDLTASHLWVVYPRTRRGDESSDIEQDLHLQIVGVWEPETLGLPGEDPASAGSDTDPSDAENLDINAPKAEGIADSAAQAPAARTKDSSALSELPPVEENYFSIRGEVVKYDANETLIMVKILQGAKRPGNTRKAFRLVIRGQLAGRTVGYFWSFDVKREGTALVMDQGNLIGIVPPKKNKGRKGGAGDRPRSGGTRRPGSSSGSGAPRPQKPSRPERSEDRPQRSISVPGHEPVTDD